MGTSGGGSDKLRIALTILAADESALVMAFIRDKIVK